MRQPTLLVGGIPMLNADTLTKWMTNFETRITKEKD
ncbi:MAG: dihydroxyacetone kinase subunit L, partial [Lacticaseibacillus paracasei]|nr:dihydroxyacetone kinase subunit L [Lacticaseibacillus paracasei]MDN6565406.1 dihydroxyacetone kinase subunit L [Lacticaseibacillus paracasei]MDN6767207.1 dihydroxyacetone kinase subunit L [Lacticaseibacillus paracasei]